MSNKNRTSEKTEKVETSGGLTILASSSTTRISQADRKEAGKYAAEMRKERRGAHVLEEEPDSIEELVGLTEEEIIAQVRQIEAKKRKQPDYYFRKLGMDNLWLITEFLSSMTLAQFCAIRQCDREWICRMSMAWEEDWLFEYLFPDRAIAEFCDANGKPLRGGRRIGYWRAKDPKAASEQEVLARQKRFLRKTLQACEEKVRNMIFGARMRKLCEEPIDEQDDLQCTEEAKKQRKELRAGIDDLQLTFVELDWKRQKRREREEWAVKATPDKIDSEKSSDGSSGKLE